MLHRWQLWLPQRLELDIEEKLEDGVGVCVWSRYVPCELDWTLTVVKTQHTKQTLGWHIR